MEECPYSLEMNMTSFRAKVSWWLQLTFKWFSSLRVCISVYVARDKANMTKCPLQNPGEGYVCAYRIILSTLRMIKNVHNTRLEENKVKNK